VPQLQTNKILSGSVSLMVSCISNYITTWVPRSTAARAVRKYVAPK